MGALAAWLPLSALAQEAQSKPAIQPTRAEKLIVAGHWKQARALVEARMREAPDDPLANYLLSQIRNAFGDHTTPQALAEKAVALDGNTAKYHRQYAEVLGVMARDSAAIEEWRESLRLDPESPASRDLKSIHGSRSAVTGSN
jgi:predicted Zn-dependent protease